MGANGAGISWESVGEDPMVRDLAARMARHSNRRPESVLSSLSGLAREISVPAVLFVARQPFHEHDLEFPVVKNRVRAYANKNTPAWAFCTAGVTAIEISPNGFYGRCPKTGAKRIYLGDVRQEGPLKTLDLTSGDLGCSIRCPQLMCFTNNVIRGTDRADFTRQLDQEGVRGVYRSQRRGHDSKIFIRWKLTDVCNYTCAYCTDWRTVNKKGVELTDAEMMAAAERIVGQFDAISMRMTGGEPSSRRCYVDLMRLFHDNLNRFTDIEIRTNLSYQAKHKEVLGWDWEGKLHLHVGCHLRDKNFMPWRTIELLRGAPDADYVLKFVSTPTIRHHVMFFKQYFVDNGIPEQNILIVEDVTVREAGLTELEEAPQARKTLENPHGSIASTIAVPAGEAVAPAADITQAGTNGVLHEVRRFTLTDLRAMTREARERQTSDVLVEQMAP